MNLIHLTRYMYCLVIFFLFTTCTRDSTMILLLQNTYPGMDTVDICVAYIPSHEQPGNCSKRKEKDGKLWSGTVPFTKNTKSYLAKAIRLEEQVDCCLQIEITYRGEQLSQGSGSWHPGSNYDLIHISQKGGAFLVDSKGSRKMPDGFDEMSLQALDDFTKKILNLE